MELFYLGLVALLFVLAVFDLFVGVSNDAVNFLSSAVGARAAKLRTVIIIAAVGVFCGAAMSNGMMEIARHGIFHPALFSFRELMCVFLAVMVTDIVLLDLFNTLGLPTSTTVSMVFELLGATFALALVKIAADTTGALSLSALMNTEKALSVIMAIFVSVAIAFVFGALVQWLSRLLFSFHLEKASHWKLGLFGGLCATAIVWFMLIKGAKDLTFMSPEMKAAIAANTWTIVASCAVGLSLLMWLLSRLGAGVLRCVVLLGTFALAMAFAGNDLVNFIGVPLAGFSAYTDFAANGGGDASGYFMGSLDSAARTPAVFLIGAGCIMVYSLMTSKKAQGVVRTSVDLARQAGGDEMFGSSRLARSLVRYTTGIGSSIADMVPQGIRQWTERRFDTTDARTPDGAAFDMLRAAVNLVMASLLVALGTSLKLPLSTTYVAFMVAMGSSLADRAWGRDSAVYRITGVLSVVGGWFLTAGAAFTLCFGVALAMRYGGMPVMALLAAAAVAVLIRSNMRYRKKQQESADALFDSLVAAEDKAEVRRLLSRHIAHHLVGFLGYAARTWRQTAEGLATEDLAALRQAEREAAQMKDTLKKVRHKEMVGLQRMDRNLAVEKSTWFHLVSNSVQQMNYCLRRIAEPSRDHVDNHFRPLPAECAAELRSLGDDLALVLRRAREMAGSGDYTPAEDARAECDRLKARLSEARRRQQLRMQDDTEGMKIHYVYLGMLQETQELVSALRHLLRAAKRFNE